MRHKMAELIPLDSQKTKQNILFRHAELSDHPKIRQLITTILSKEFPSDQAAYSTEDLELLSKTYAAPTNAFFVAEKDRNVIGTCGVKSDGPETAILRRLFVDPQYRRQGVGQGLLKGAIDFCQKSGFREIMIRTSTHMEQAIRLCLSFGFQEDGRWPMGKVTLIRFILKLS